MENTYKKLADGTIEVTVYREEKFIVTKDQLEAQRANTVGSEAVALAQIDKELARFDSLTAEIVKVIEKK